MDVAAVASLRVGNVRNLRVYNAELFGSPDAPSRQRETRKIFFRDYSFCLPFPLLEMRAL